MKHSVIAVIVTYNRQALLAECLAALEAQTRLPDKVLVVDNASTDGTAAFLQAYEAGGFELETRRLASNLGGAGGFSHGIGEAYRQGCDWVWVMDDDTIATPEALAALLAVVEDQTAGYPSPLLLASRVDWTDGTPHPMNMPRVAGEDWQLNYACLSRALFPIRSASFVSILLSAQAIRQFGLPIADYFIWCDDVEYTARILKTHPGFVVPSSVVIHKTHAKYTPLDVNSGRLYFAVRNAIWMAKSPAWNRKERLMLAVSNLATWLEYLKRGQYSWSIIKRLARPVFDGLFKTPRPDTGLSG